MAFKFGFLKFGKKQKNPTVRHVYDQLVKQARHPDFYKKYQVPDTLSGRFDMIVLHAFVFFWRLKDEGETAKNFGQDVFDTFIEDMDRSLREMGVGYQAIPKRIRKMGEAFYGRINAYDAALQDGNHEKLCEALQRNIYPDIDIKPDVVKSLASYTMTAVKELRDCDMNELYKARFTLPDPLGFLTTINDG